MKYDSDDNGICDADEDIDEDGLSFRQELDLTTDPFNNDTDFDGLSDGDEVNVYGTDPLKRIQMTMVLLTERTGIFL